jgi:hypothetical protein
MLGLTWFQTGTKRKEPAVHSAFQPLNKGGIVFSEQLVTKHPILLKH